MVIDVSDCFQLRRMLDDDLAPSDTLSSLSVSDSPLREVLFPLSSGLFNYFWCLYLPACLQEEFH